MSKIDEVAIAISGAPFPSKASKAKARKAIAAMRIPTEAMVNSGYDLDAMNCQWPVGAGEIFTAMIDAALNDK